DERIELEPFLEDEIVGVAKPGLVPLKNGAAAPAQLSEFLLLAREPGSSSQQIIDEELRAIGINPAGLWELGSSEAIKRAAREGLGLAFLSRYALVFRRLWANISTFPSGSYSVASPPTLRLCKSRRRSERRRGSPRSLVPRRCRGR